LILTDAGPLIALLRADDPSHDACVKVAGQLRPPMATVWPAFTEAMHIVGSWPARRALLSLLEQDSLVLLPILEADVARISELMEKYRDVPMDLADAALVTVAERVRLRRIFTLDRRGFSAYRLKRFGKFQIVP